MNDAFSLAGKIAFITGSTTGIGRMLAEGLSAAGATVWGHGPNRDALAGLDRQLDGRVLTADFTQPAQIDVLAADLSGKIDHLDVLVNNAGIEIPMPLETWDMATFEKTMQVNLHAPVKVTSLLLPLLKRSASASVINITSIHDTVPYAHNAAYSMSKAGLAMFTKVMALELAPHHIRINNFAPGAVETNINREVLARMGHDKFAEWIPLGRVSHEDDVVPPVVFLASDASRYMTGATLYADGGYMLNLVRYRL